MKELRLQVNVPFYTIAISIVITLLAISAVVTNSHDNLLLKNAMILSFILVSAINVNLVLALSGKRKASLCNNGLHYVSALGRRVYIPVEQITHISVKKYCGIKMTKISTSEVNIHFLSFQFSNLQELKLKKFGYLAQ
ncbi:hypothetical protein PSECIP111854_02019 [Pseudoalteromonas sp. CIP111854]|uniref:Uncharacterized protein n=1 Tax=Pseudoalteromonas holothuriae TaxID=2963714 RepID=A0A9W4QXC9_9GAMM|nr:hypothetical protein [Pseudoalteromonas sp. CIP111854]CAH9057544.1 hypothetical protein PSECIP111854_02019 [Pseudoalteromonas sp. CIP111854]